MVTRRGSGLLFPSVLEGGEKGELAFTLALMTTNLQIHLRAARMEDKRYTMSSFRVGRAATHSMDFTGVDVLRDTWGASPQR